MISKKLSYKTRQDILRKMKRASISGLKLSRKMGISQSLLSGILRGDYGCDDLRLVDINDSIAKCVQDQISVINK